jgi:hypothetical protein
MRIFVQPRNGDSFKRIVWQAINILHDARIASAQPDDSASMVLVDPEDLPDALTTLEQAGVRARTN